jgi:glyoxylase-like metal-dependent hydrolase (beta-lactamase superfamily II)
MNASVLAQQGIEVLERGWLSSNNVLIADDAEATLVDSGYATHAMQTESLVRHALRGRRLTRLVNTHLHADHCGGNARLQRAFGCEVWIPPGQWDAALGWDTEALSYAPTSQKCERFAPDRKLVPGVPIELGGKAWQVLAAPGHDPHAVMLFEPEAGVLVAGDALWENGFGVVFPELEGDEGFEAVSATLDLIASLAARVVVPGHGSPFTTSATALERARRKLDAFVARPDRHAQHAAKVLIKFRLLETQRETIASLQRWAYGVAYLRLIHAAYSCSMPMDLWFKSLVAELTTKGVLARAGDEIVNI